MPAFCDVVLKAEETLQNAAIRRKQWADGQKQTCEALMSRYSIRCNDTWPASEIKPSALMR
jgi:hypothetical protein